MNPTTTPKPEAKPTPRTDEMIERAACASGRESDWVNPDFARQLERELAEMRDALEREAKSHDIAADSERFTAEQRAAFRTRAKCIRAVLGQDQPR